MVQKRNFVIGSLVAVLLFNAGLLAALLYLNNDPMLSGTAPDSSGWTVLGVALVVSLLLWFVIQWMGGRAIEREVDRAVREASEQTEQRVRREMERAATPPPPVVREAPKPAPKPPAPPSYTPAIQILSILQREGRLIDFLQEDLSAYQDDQIGAAVRNVHAGCKKVLAEHVELEPIYSEPEGSSVTVAPGFDASAIRLSGNVVGEPPFTGVLRHRGWRVATIELPQRMASAGDERVVAAAEVELGS